MAYAQTAEPATAAADDAAPTTLHVLTSGGFTAAYTALGPSFTQNSGVALDTILGPSMGATPQAIPQRLARHEPADVVIMVGYALDDLIKKGLIVPGSRVELGDSRIGLVVREGAPSPDISTEPKLKATLLHAKSIAYSDSASGVYIRDELFKKLGIADQVAGKATMIPRTPVAESVAAGKYQLGFQQVAELLPVKGVTFVGRIPEKDQSVTRYAAAIPRESAHPVEARALLAYLASPEAQPVIRKTGMDAVTGQ
ncbi:substrate-binding domain-containing protein [Robbsia sp. KACC 23696]|uniref:substrate-binding domain-containing protein n=1 Tax=Robbsia sp. KACC 23696 TaxID=3149231 RepID=UPI00325AFC6A